jgi:GntR family transcriptional regulator/MocR family aminotransferase
MQLHVDFSGATSGLQHAVYDAVRQYILTGELKGGARLPSTREFAFQLGVSRNTVTLAYERLVGEDLVEGRERSGLFVRRLGALPTAAPDERSTVGQLPPNIARLVDIYSYVSQADRLRPFAVGTPALDEFPSAIWGRLARRHLRSAGPQLLGYGDPLGLRPLREAICDHVSLSRGVRCSPDQILVCAGAQAGLYLSALVFCGLGGEAWVEDPGYGGAYRAISAAGGVPVSVPVDHAGLNVEAGLELSADARFVIVTPSNQFPTGVAMSGHRRVQLLNWAEQRDAWICEDDYDSEFRFDGRPLTSLYALQFVGGRRRRVIYSGSFSKSLFPALKIGYLVLPPEIVDTFVAARAMIGREPPSLEQAILADFIGEGHFARHLRRMRRIYAARAAALETAVSAYFPGRLHMAPIKGGLQAFARLMPGERLDAWKLAFQEVGAMPDYAQMERNRAAIVMGFANTPPDRIDKAARALSRASSLAG